MLLTFKPFEKGNDLHNEDLQNMPPVYSELEEEKRQGVRSS